MPQVPGQSAGFYIAIHRIMDGLGLEGTLQSISWACFSWGGLPGTPTFFSIGKALPPKKCFLFQGCVTHFLFSAFNDFSLALQSPLHPHTSECRDGSQQCSKLHLQAFPADTCLQCPAPASRESPLESQHKELQSFPLPLYYRGGWVSAPQFSSSIGKTTKLWRNELLRPLINRWQMEKAAKMEGNCLWAK